MTVHPLFLAGISSIISLQVSSRVRDLWSFHFATFGDGPFLRLIWAPSPDRKLEYTWTDRLVYALLMYDPRGGGG